MAAAAPPASAAGHVEGQPPGAGDAEEEDGGAPANEEMRWQLPVASARGPATKRDVMVLSKVGLKLLDPIFRVHGLWI